MASNPTPVNIDELIASGEDLCDGILQHEASLGIVQNSHSVTRTELDALIAAENAFKIAQGSRPVAYAALRSADSNGKGFIARAINVLKISLGNSWTDSWLPTGLPNNSVGVPGTQDERFAALTGLAGYFTNAPGQENIPLIVTALAASAAYDAVSNARQGVGNALTLIATTLISRNEAKENFRLRYRGTINEIEQLLNPDDPRWYDFGLNRPADPSTPGQPATVLATPLGGGYVLVQVDGARRANSFNYYKKVIGTDPDPVKVINDPSTQYTIAALPIGATVEFTVTGVNDAGEGLPSNPVSIVVS